MGKTSGNKKVRDELIQIYGNECMFEKARIEQKISVLKNIRTFRSFKNEKKFKRQVISYELTLHHLRHRSEGGKTNIENGAVLSEVAHQYIHSLPREQEELINNLLRQFKFNFALMIDGKIQEESANSFFIDPDTEFLEIPVYTNKKEINREAKMKRLKNKTRAQKKKELKEILEDELEKEER